MWKIIIIVILEFETTMENTIELYYFFNDDDRKTFKIFLNLQKFEFKMFCPQRNHDCTRMQFTFNIKSMLKFSKHEMSVLKENLCFFNESLCSNFDYNSKLYKKNSFMIPSLFFLSLSIVRGINL